MLTIWKRTEARTYSWLTLMTDLFKVLVSSFFKKKTNAINMDRILDRFLAKTWYSETLINRRVCRNGITTVFYRYQFHLKVWLITQFLFLLFGYIYNSVFTMLRSRFVKVACSKGRNSCTLSFTRTSKHYCSSFPVKQFDIFTRLASIQPSPSPLWHSYQLFMSRKNAHPVGFNWLPSSFWNSEIRTSLSVVPIELNCCNNFASTSLSTSIFALAQI